MTRELALALLAAWLSCWAAEERALTCAARDRMLTTSEVREHLDVIRREREQVRALLL